MNDSPYICVHVAARKYIYKSVKTVARMCREGMFKSARKASPAPKAHWQILRSEVIATCCKSNHEQ